MGHGFKKQHSKPLPKNAETFTKKGALWARWTDRWGKTRTARLTNDGQRILCETSVWYVRYENAKGGEVTLCTGFKEKSNAEAKLAELVRDVERAKVGIVSPQESQIADHRRMPLTEHIEAFIAHLEAAGRSSVHRKDTRRQFLRLEAECNFKTFAELTAEMLEKWLVPFLVRNIVAKLTLQH